MSAEHLSPEQLVLIRNRADATDFLCPFPGPETVELAAIRDRRALLDYIESQAARIAQLQREASLAQDANGQLEARVKELEQEVKDWSNHAAVAVNEAAKARTAVPTNNCPECGQYNVRYSVVMKDLQSLASKISGGDCSNSHGLDCTTIIAHHWDKATRQSLPPGGGQILAVNEWCPVINAPHTFIAGECTHCRCAENTGESRGN